MTEEQLYKRLHDSAYDMVMESAARGVDLSYNIAWMRVVGRYNRDQKRWIREWRERERNKKKGEKMSVRLF